MPTISIRIEEEEKKALQIFAAQQDVSISWVVRRAIKDYIEKQKQDKD